MRRRIGIGVLVVLGLGLGAYLAALGYVVLNMNRSTLQQADVALVLGSRVYRGGQLNPCLVKRVEEGVEVVWQGWARWLVVSGGVDPEDGAIEAEAMASMAARLGLPEERVVLEPKARSTYQNLRFTRQIMKERGWNTVVIVSEPFHLPRAALMARQLGLEFALAPSPHCPQNLPAFLREPLVLLYYALRGWKE
ncbi:YdcF family protein [Calidithermus roseus]|uniref:DUF218 domain-containing protein n=1 Tax=Calidithermus roseus TaxID=1644118 RepID=A0A399EX97_9DEIN|nr:YdcF family protein [Calidithermus roseus]RIH88215.1 hypothetical protein Mrose_00944 [Calidithermus roseus]